MNSRLDLKVLLASIAAALAVVTIALVFAHNRNVEDVNQAVSNAARLITSLPSDALADDVRQSAYSRVLSQLATDPRFAYATVQASSGEVISRIAAAGTSIPELKQALPADNTSWINHSEPRTIDGRTAAEVHGPLSASTGQARYRIAYFRPALLDSASDLVYLASIVLPIFLLTPLFLLFLRREVVPLEGLARTLSETDADGASDAEPVGTFVEQFNVFMDQAQKRIDSYQSERDKLVTAERFLNYRVIKLESILHAISNGIAIVDGNQRVTFANDHFCQYLGLEGSTVVGEAIHTLFSASEFSDAASLLTNSTSKQQQTVDITPAGLAGTTLRVSVQQVAAGKSEETVARVVVMQDVSAEILAKNSRGDFVSHVSHELKTPLNTLSLCVQSLQGPDGEDTEYRHETLNVINDEVERLALLINNLLSITQIEMGTLEIQTGRVKVSDLISQAVEAIRRVEPEKKLRFSTDIADDIDTAQLDKSLISIALNNLLTNAVKYSNEGGAVRVAVAESEDSLQFSVTDTGIGIPESELDSIFQKFKRGQADEVSDRSGHGLGLSLARDIVELHHGNIRVQSKAGAGSKFTIDLWKQAGVLEQAI